MALSLVREAAPRLEPPYDDELPERGRTWATDGSLALALPMTMPRRTTLHIVPDLPPRDPRTGRDITPSALLPDVQPRAAQLVRAVLEVLARDRPARHLVRVATNDVVEHLEYLSRPTNARPWARSVRGLRVSCPASGVAEVAAVIERGGRCGALALRLEGLDGRWIVTELALP